MKEVKTYEPEIGDIVVLTIYDKTEKYTVERIDEYDDLIYICNGGQDICLSKSSLIPSDNAWHLKLPDFDTIISRLCPEPRIL